jgi:hypothetical protein
MTCLVSCIVVQDLEPEGEQVVQQAVGQTLRFLAAATLEEGTR